jgi:NTE family protein
MKRPKIGLALGSGGPRGLAHIGVIKVLEQNNIPIDYIAGSSIGAMVGGFYAAKKDIKKVESIALGADRKLMLSLLDPTFRQGLLAGDKVKKYIESHIGGITFDDLKIPLSVVATNLKNGDVVVFDKGKVAPAIRASISFPLVFKPVELSNRLLADGGLSAPVPVEVVRKMGAEFVIAVNLDADYFADSNSKSSTFGFYKIADNSMNLLRHHLALWNVKDADIVIDPRVGNANWMNFWDGKDVIAAGERAADEVLPQLQKLLEQKHRRGLSKYLDFLKG